mmetsp:Transcript_59941/g.118886  ORF Transcript_59941/g.118886 Transcript_59941/m.118886 type:complete len:246 (+) Transcript_59941:443-1180(+)
MVFEGLSCVDAGVGSAPAAFDFVDAANTSAPAVKPTALADAVAVTAGADRSRSSVTAPVWLITPGRCTGSETASEPGACASACECLSPAATLEKQSPFVAATPSSTPAGILSSHSHRSSLCSLGAAESTAALVDRRLRRFNILAPRRSRRVCRKLTRPRRLQMPMTCTVTSSPTVSTWSTLLVGRARSMTWSKPSTLAPKSTSANVSRTTVTWPRARWPSLTPPTKKASPLSPGDSRPYLLGIER